MHGGEAKQFGWLRSIFWPISRQESRMILPMFFMIFLICINYSILRNTKDALVVTANAGAEVIPFIKVWAMLPVAVLLTLAFTKLSNRFSQERVFYLMTGGFLLFYALFLFVLYPLRDTLHPHAFADRLEAMLPLGFKGLIAVFRTWTFTSFYVMSELWSVMVLTVLFWGFANEVTRIADASRFYAVINIGCNLAAIIAGQIPSFFLRESQEESLQILLGIVLVCGVATIAIFRWMNKYVLNHPSFDALHQERYERKQKKKLSIWESFAYVAKSKYLMCIAAIVVGYNLVIHIVEVVWKDELRRLHPDFNAYNAYLGDLTTTIGIVSMVLALLIPTLIRRWGWKNTALVMPISMLITGISFFSLLLLQGKFSDSSITFLTTAPLAALVFTGAVQNVASKACKYSLFDATKEMAFIPLDHDKKLKGKAAIDGVGSRLGKSGGSLLFQGLLLVSGSLAASVPYIAAILLVTIVIWIAAVRSLAKQFNALTHGAEAAPEPLLDDNTETGTELGSVKLDQPIQIKS